jgi:hypothetical protein
MARIGESDCKLSEPRDRMRQLLSRRNYKIADAAALKLRGALDDEERIRLNPSFDPRGASCLLG